MSQASAMSCLRSPAPNSSTSLEISVRRNYYPTASYFTFSPASLLPSLPLSGIRVSRIYHSGVPARPLAPLEAADFEDNYENVLLEPPETSTQVNVENLPTDPDDCYSLMKMERIPSVSFGAESSLHTRWFPYRDKFRCGTTSLNSFEVLEAVGPCIFESRKETFRNAVENRSYSLCLVVEGLSDFSNVSAACRSADAFGVQSVHVISCDNSIRCNIEVSIQNIDWSCPTAIVVGDDGKGVSDEASELSDMHCTIPMQGMVGSFNISVAAGILMHHAVCDRISRLGFHGDLSLKQRQILLAEFYLRHSKSATTVADEYAKRKAIAQPSKL